MSKKTKLQLAQDEAQAAINETNKIIEKLGENTSDLHDVLNNINEIFDKIRNIPNDTKIQYEKLKKIRLDWKQQTKKIEADYKNATIKKVGAGATCATAGVAVVALGPTAAMGIATTFGVASTGTAISALSGAAATNAALAWLGGGALVAGGGGMAAGNALLALAGPIGWAISGVALITTGILIWKSKSDKKAIEDIFTLISRRDIKSYHLAIAELNERISRIVEEAKKLNEAILHINTFGFDYNKMNESQQYELGAYVNLLSSSTQLLISPIMGLLPKYTDTDFEKYISWTERKIDNKTCYDFRNIIVFLSNLLYKIDLNQKEKKLLHKTFSNNKKLLKSLDMKKREFTPTIIDAVVEALHYKQSLR